MFGVIGCGQMGGALLSGWLEAGILRPEAVRVADPHTGASWAARGVAEAPVEVILSQATEILLAVKPQHLSATLSPLRAARAYGAGAIKGRVFSILAGAARADLISALGTPRVVRLMPNVSARIGAGVTLLLDAGEAEDLDRAEALFGAVGRVERLSHEGLFYAGTALSGCGPAYAALVMEAMADGAVAAGLPRASATRLAAATLEGAARMILEGDLQPAALKDAVTSPGGVTIQGVRALEAGGLRASLIEAVIKAAERAEAMERGR
ncbi:pyrroline-5-carboxylate reductase [Myxococcota bacterium]|nr:pyrroline-5-carboxylate reductase [Myxococcota bacterium]MBU1431022.1 pyrroline-5-carboxylate reductase [Myxococcota bacterium]MBU1900484.1 pyrroline-5-carboxylate reductase [Myxococcota bacterium]